MKKLVAGIVFGLASVYASFTGYSPTNYPNGLEVGNAISIDKTVGVLTINATALNLSGAASLGGTIAVDNILEKTSAHGVSIDGVLLKDGYGNFTGGNTADAPNLYLRSNAGIYSGGSGRIALNSLGSGGYDAGYVDASGTFRINNIVTVNGVIDLRAKDLVVANTITSNFILATDGTSTAYIAPQGAGGVFIGTNTNHNTRLGANNTTVQYILPNGNVGIGITTPDAKLDVNGSVQVPYQTTYQMKNSDGIGKGVFYASGNAVIIRDLGGVNNVVYVSGNSVGIGTTAPSTKLDVAGTVSANQPYAEVYMNTITSFASNVPTPVTYDTTVVLSGITYTGSTFTVPTRGRYVISGQQAISGTGGTTMYTYIYINGSEASRDTSLLAGGKVRSISAIRQLNANDSIQIRCETDSTDATFTGLTAGGRVNYVTIYMLP